MAISVNTDNAKENPNAVFVPSENFISPVFLRTRTHGANKYALSRRTSWQKWIVTPL
jgi:hypothetical protein